MLGIWYATHVFKFCHQRMKAMKYTYVVGKILYRNIQLGKKILKNKYKLQLTIEYSQK